MNCMAEALGLALPGNGTVPAVYGKRRELAKYSGMRLMDLFREEITPRSILTREAFENAITVDMAIGGSSNTILHLMAIANEAQVDLDLDDFRPNKPQHAAPLQSQSRRQLLRRRPLSGRRHSRR